MSIFATLTVTGLNAAELKVMSLSGDGELVFTTPASGSADHHYRVECTTSLVSTAWATRRSICGVGPSKSVANLVPDTAPSMFYRVVSSLNSAVFVDGEYMVIDLSGGTAASTYAVTYYTGAAAVPDGVTNDVYKTTKLVMRRIPKGTFTMGARATDYPEAAGSGLHTVTLTKDFYIGVFEVTQRQWELVMGNRPSYFNNSSYYATRPVENVSYYDIRENPANSDDPAVNWPANSAVNASSFMGKLRAKTGLSAFDLPTESQWEYACRAGTATALNTGYNMTSTSSDPRMDAAGRYYYNGGSGYSQSCATSEATAKVGSCLSNAWGLYDMHGNVYEWCLDWYGTNPGTVSDPYGAASASFRMLRGGGFYDEAPRCSSAIRYLYYPLIRSGSGGFRAAGTLP